MISNREHLAAVKPDGLFLILELMHFASEILSADVLQNGSNTAVTDKELKMAQALIESMNVVWEPERYRDEYRTALMEIIEQKGTAQGDYNKSARYAYADQRCAFG